LPHNLAGLLCLCAQDIRFIDATYSASMLQASRARDLRSIHPTQIFRSLEIESLGPLYFLPHYYPSSRRTNFHKHFGKRAGIPPPPPSITHIKHPRLQTNPETISQNIENAKPSQLTTYFPSTLLRTFLWLFPLPFTPPNHITHISNLNHQQPPINRQTLLFPLPSSYSHLTFSKKHHPTGFSLLSILYS
jgi:hypothetical protein